MRLRQKPWADAEFDKNPAFVRLPALQRGSWAELFQNLRPIHLEIGCGKGAFAVKQALANPNVNFLAMEKKERIICMALRQARDAGLPPNLRFICDSAENLEQIFSPKELNRIYINFCDPWRARGKWRKRRLTHRDFLEMYKTLMVDGEVHFKTDDPLLFQFSINEFEATGWRLQNINSDLYGGGPGFEGNIATEYEEKFVVQGVKICRLEAVTP